MTGTFRSGRRLACVALLTALPLTACAAGYQAETSRERTTLTSVSAAKGALTLRNIFVVGPGKAGSSVGVYMAIFNGGSSSDRIVSITTPGGTGVVPQNATVPSDGSLFYNNGDGDVPQITNLKSDLLVGQTVQVTVTFAGAGDVAITIPVIGGNGLPGPSPTPTPTPTVSPTPSAKPTIRDQASSKATPGASATPAAASGAKASASPSPAP